MIDDEPLDGTRFLPPDEPERPIPGRVDRMTGSPGQAASAEVLASLRSSADALERLDQLAIDIGRASTPTMVLDVLVRALAGDFADVSIATVPGSVQPGIVGELGASHGVDDTLLAGMVQLLKRVEHAESLDLPPWLLVRSGSALLVERLRIDDLESSLGIGLPLLQQSGDVSMIVVPWSRTPDSAGAVIVVRSLAKRPEFTQEDVTLVRQVVDHFGAVHAARQAQIGEATNLRFRRLVRNAPIGILQFDKEGACIYANDAWAEVSGIGRRESEGDGWRDAMPPEKADALIASCSELEPGGPPQTDTLWLLTGRSRRRAVSVSLQGEWDDFGRRVGTVVAVIDETARRFAEEQLRRQVDTDPLTGLANRRNLFETLDRMLVSRAEGVFLVVAFVDLDRFKQVNDLLGHADGDRVLVDVARGLRLAARPGETVARVGGDEFVLILSITDVGTVDARIAEVQRALTSQVASAGFKLTVAGSIGVVVIEPGDTSLDADVLIGRADAAMYEAKASGRNRVVVFDHAHQLRLEDRHRLELELERVLFENRVGVAYLPVVDLFSGAVVGVEALARIRAIDGGALDPGTFVDVAEQTGLIVQLGDIVLSHAFTDFAQWLPAHPNLLCTLNLSLRQLSQPAAVEQFLGRLDESGLPPERICIELTEAAFVDIVEDLGVALDRLRAAGVRLAIDDFGTSYSSLTRIRDLNVDAIKVDSTFVQRVSEDPVDAVVVSAAVQLAESLRIDVIAEGIETPEQLAAVRQLGCRYGQGFVFGRPTSAALVEQVFRRTFVTGR